MSFTKHRSCSILYSQESARECTSDIRTSEQQQGVKFHTPDQGTGYCEVDLRAKKAPHAYQNKNRGRSTFDTHSAKNINLKNAQLTGVPFAVKDLTGIDLEKLR